VAGRGATLVTQARALPAQAAAVQAAVGTAHQRTPWNLLRRCSGASPRIHQIRPVRPGRPWMALMAGAALGSSCGRCSGALSKELEVQ